MSLLFEHEPHGKVKHDIFFHSIDQVSLGDGAPVGGDELGVGAPRQIADERLHHGSHQFGHLLADRPPFILK